VYSNEKCFESKNVYFYRLLSQIGSSSPEEILKDPEVLSRVKFLKEEQEKYIGTISKYTRIDENIIITDIRTVECFPNGDKFLVYTLYPNQNVSLKVFNKRHTEDTVISCGYNIFNRTCKTHIGDLMQCFGGGGHKAAGSCRIKSNDADMVLNTIISKLREFKHIIN
jgi:nanoRNase/pAp phosphatase (c-di-AMP/oligoRNAs hydrolase)